MQEANLLRNVQQYYSAKLMVGSYQLRCFAKREWLDAL